MEVEDEWLCADCHKLQDLFKAIQAYHRLTQLNVAQLNSTELNGVKIDNKYARIGYKEHTKLHLS